MTMIDRAKLAPTAVKHPFIKAAGLAALPMVHAGLASSFIIAWFTAEIESLMWVHVWSGYAMLACVVLRLLLGIVGAPSDRLSLMRVRIGRAWTEAKAIVAQCKTDWQSAGLAGILKRMAQANRSVALCRTFLPLLTLGIYIFTCMAAVTGVLVFEQWLDAWQWLADAVSEVHGALGDWVLFATLGHLLCVGLILIVKGGSGVRPIWRFRARSVDRR